MANLFKNVACFTDIHFGLKNNSRQHNIDCEHFLYWFIKEAKKRGCETCIFLGDWHNSRDKINVSTLNYTISNMERLSEAFEEVYIIAGNHDLYYRDKREINSIEFGRNLDNVHIISDLLVEGDCAIVPWLVDNEWKQIKNFQCKYMFGHFELPHFKMNAMVEMPDTGELHVNDLDKPDMVFSGHFHKRQVKDNVVYMGNCFPHNFSDVDDNDRGAMFLEWDGDPEFMSWPEAPIYQKIKLSEIVEQPDKVLLKNSYSKVEIDIRITYEYASYIKEVMLNEYDVREINLLPIIENNVDMDFDNDTTFESVDKVVLEHLEAVESNNIDNELLAAIYLEL